MSSDKSVKLVGVVLGSASDLDKVQPALEVFTKFKIPYEIAVISAHRTPDLLKEYAETALRRGIKVLVAAAGLSAALPGVLASHTVLPVIGLPIDAGSVGGLDALLSIAQMPPGIPVGSVGIDAGRNAALLAVRILALFDESLSGELISQRRAMVDETQKRNAALAEKGFPVWIRENH